MTVALHRAALVGGTMQLWRILGPGFLRCDAATHIRISTDRLSRGGGTQSDHFAKMPRVALMIESVRRACGVQVVCK